MQTAEQLKKELRGLANPIKAGILQSFFKTGPGEYAEGDIFLGIMVPQSRLLVRKYRDLDLEQIDKLFHSKFHEERLTALLILVSQFERGDEKIRKLIYEYYLQHTELINNWDLVDLTAPKIVGSYLLNKPRAILYKLMKSKNIWERRIAVLATFMFIRQGQFEDTLILAEQLLGDKHDLMHKAVGWMLREMGKRDEVVLEMFLIKFKDKMPRTMLRYAIEKFSEKKRKMYLTKAV